MLPLLLRAVTAVGNTVARSGLLSDRTIVELEHTLAVAGFRGRRGLSLFIGGKLLLLVLLDTGMRVSELCGLRLADVHDRYVKVFGKGRKEREIGLHPEVGKLLWKYIQKYRSPTNPDEDALFIGRYGKQLGMEGVRGLLHSAFPPEAVGNVIQYRA